VHGPAAVRAAAAVHLSPAGQIQVAVALDMLTCLEDQLHGLRHRLLDAAGHLAAQRPWPSGSTASGRSPRWR
jgi:hypothetical protein